MMFRPPLGRLPRPGRDRDPRRPRNPYARKIADLKASEHWVARTLEPFRRTVLRDMALFLPQADLGGLSVAHLTAVVEAQAPEPYEALKEVCRVAQLAGRLCFGSVLDFGWRCSQSLAFVFRIFLCFPMVFTVSQLCLEFVFCNVPTASHL